jgi:hypothetical protein
MPSVLAKWQKCGKSGCRCDQGFLHGPYFWLVTYISTRSTGRRAGKYSWIYLGSSPDRAWDKLISIDNLFERYFQKSSLSDKLSNLKNKSISQTPSSYTTPLLSLPDG